MKIINEFFEKKNVENTPEPDFPIESEEDALIFINEKTPLLFFTFYHTFRVCGRSPKEALNYAASDMAKLLSGEVTGEDMLQMVEESQKVQ